MRGVLLLAMTGLAGAGAVRLLLLLADGDASGKNLAMFAGVLSLTVLFAFASMYAFFTHVRLYRDRLVIWAPPFSKEKYFRDIAHAGLYRSEHEGSLLILDGERILELRVEEYAPDDLEMTYEFILDARRTFGYGELKWLPDSAIEKRRKMRNRYFLVGVGGAAILLLAMFLYA
ncbi:MAG: hypothetical protein LPK90_01570 [Alphaproteobacteria bacterium]|nr:hypothetical protein [Alphaproteobacteria bacterium]MDX5492186.1 hypothetical protein [Alphaproteobacteria bacterium]